VHIGWRNYERNYVRNYAEKMSMKIIVHKIRKVSTHSYALTLPKEFVKKFGWKERQKVEIIFGGRKHELKIRDWKPTKK
jgi:bifunctional DNA-binding transcriptional regulator/antitoxin component of YhaV-PrlF toxin-antitoxin module